MDRQQSVQLIQFHKPAIAANTDTNKRIDNKINPQAGLFWILNQVPVQFGAAV